MLEVAWIIGSRRLQPSPDPPSAFWYLTDFSGHSRFVLRILIVRVVSAPLASRQSLPPHFGISLISADIPGSFCEFDCSRRLNRLLPAPDPPSTFWYLIDFSGHSRFVLPILIVRVVSTALASAGPSLHILVSHCFQRTFQVRFAN